MGGTVRQGAGARRAVLVGVAALVTAATATTTAAVAKERAPADAGRSFAEGPGLVGGQQHHASGFTIHAVASDGTPIGTGGAAFVVRIAEPEPTRVKVKDNHDGTYGVAYTPASPGTYVIEITLGGAPVRDAPFLVPVRPAPSPAHSFADGAGLGSPTAGQETAFTIHAAGEDGTPLVTGGDTFQVGIHGPGGTVPWQEIDNEDGTYTVRYTPLRPGIYTIKATYEGRAISTSPHQVAVQPA